MMILGVTEWLSGFLTPVIALVTTAILFLQYFLAKQRWRLDLYDKRFPVYMYCMEFIRFVNVNASIDDEVLNRFLQNSRDRDFLFSKDIQKYLNQLIEQGNRLHSNIKRKKEMNTSSEGWDRECDLNDELIEWFANQLEVCKKKFGEYLKLENH